MPARASIRGVHWLLAVLCVPVLVSCSSEPTNTANRETATTVRRSPRTTTSTTPTSVAPRPRPSFVEETPGDGSAITEPPATEPAVRQRPVGPVDTAPPETQPPDTSPPDTEPPAPLVDPPPETFYYPDCDTAKAEGAAPLYYGYEGYWSALDPDHDGVACDT